MVLSHNQTSFGGEPDNCSGSAFTAGAVAALDEFTKRQRCLSFAGFHGIKISRVNGLRPSGIPPMGEFAL